MMTTIYKEAKRLHGLGFAILLIHPKSKRPVKSGWTSGERESWTSLKSQWVDGMNIGVRTGEASKIGANYLACIDVDIKSPEAKPEAMRALKELLRGASLPEVRSGSGNGSRHLYCVTSQPFKMITVAKHETWEVCIYSSGRQMVLAPSVHPSGGTYEWRRPIESVNDLPLMDFSLLSQKPAVREKSSHAASTPDFKFAVNEVDIDWLPLPKDVYRGIKYGDNVTDRSSYLLRASSALLSVGLTQNEILSVLTDTRNSLSSCAYEHAKTSNRARAAYWLYKFTLQKIESERDARQVFAKGLKDVPVRALSVDEVLEQAKEFKLDRSWKQDIARTKNGVIISTLQNVVLILENAVAKDLVRRNEFAFRDTYSIDTPWGAKADEAVKDDDIPRIIYWLAQNFNFEPSERVVYHALTVMACANAFDPVRDYLDGLAEWDGVARLSTWLRTNFEAEGCADYLGQVFSKWLAAMVRRVYEPGAKFDWMPIFEGPQGAGKSSFGRLLVGDKYFLDWLPNLADKDSALGLQGQWAVEMGELPQFKRNELETIKAFITRTVDKFRPPHGRKLLDSPRRCVFFGTTNKQTYLIDDTGNRRFKPVKVGRLNFKRLRKDRDQLFAEAKHLYRTQFTTNLSYELTGEAKIFEGQIHAEKMVEDESTVMHLAMQDFVKKIEAGSVDFDPQKFRILELFNQVGPLVKWQQNTRNMMYAAKMLKKFGGEKRTINGLSFWKIDAGGTSKGVGISENFY